MRDGESEGHPSGVGLVLLPLSRGETRATGSPALKAGELRLLHTLRRITIPKNIGRDTHISSKYRYYRLNIWHLSFSVQ